MKAFKEYITEDAKWARKQKSADRKSIKDGAKKPERPKAENTTVLFFGRMNPPTYGHEMALNQAQKLAEKHGAKLKVVASHSEGDERNPLSAKEKAKHLKRAFPHLNIEVADKEHATIMHHVKKAYDEGAKHLMVVAGGDRVKHYQQLLDHYNGTPSAGYKFNSIKVVNAGSRGEGIISASELRDHAASGDYNKFKTGLPSTMAKNFLYSKELFRDVSRGLKRASKAKEAKAKKK